MFFGVLFQQRAFGFEPILFGPTIDAAASYPKRVCEDCYVLVRWRGRWGVSNFLFLWGNVFASARGFLFRHEFLDSDHLDTTFRLRRTVDLSPSLTPLAHRRNLGMFPATGRTIMTQPRSSGPVWNNFQ